MEWSGLALAFAAFFLSHSLPIRAPLRPILVRRLGATGFGLAYSTLSIAVLAWLVMAAARAPYLPVWDWAPWQNHLALAVMLPVCLIVTLSVGRPNPFSFGGARNADFDPRCPGIVRFTRHPLLVALALWAIAHLVANGDLAHILLFGTFAAFAILGGRLVDRRKRREMGAEWDSLWARVRAQSVAGQLSHVSALRIGLGLALYLALIALHPVVIGVSPLS